MLLGCFFCGGGVGDMKMGDDEEKGGGSEENEVVEEVKYEFNF